MLTTAAVIASGALHFDASRAFDFPPGAFDFSLGFLLGLGAASRVGIYDYLGYYDICYIGDEVKDPGRVIPRSILISIVAVAAIYLAINLSIIGVVPWREFVPADAHPQSEFIVSTFMERLYGPQVATVFTFLILWTAFGSVFALLLGYSRIPYAAAQDGCFFSVFGRLHPTKRFPHVSLIVLGRHLDPVQPAAARPGDRRAHYDQDPRAVHRAGVCRDAAAREPAGHAQAVSHVALSRARGRRAGRMDLSSPHVGLAPRRARPRHSGARHRVLPGVVVALAPLAL